MKPRSTNDGQSSKRNWRANPRRPEIGAPRYTADLDAVVLLGLDDVPNLLQIASTLDIKPRIPDAEAFARKSRVLLLQYLPTETNLDISLGILPFEYEMVARSQLVEISSLSIRLPQPDDLIILKAVAHRPKDLLDIQAIATLI